MDIEIACWKDVMISLWAYNIESNFMCDMRIVYNLTCDACRTVTSDDFLSC